MKALIFLWSSWLIAPICSKVAPQFWGLAPRRAMRCLWCLSLWSHRSEENVSVWLIFYITAENSTTELMNACKHTLCSIIWTHRVLPYSHYVIKLLQPKDKAVFALDCRPMCERWVITVTRCSSTYQTSLAAMLEVLTKVKLIFSVFQTLTQSNLVKFVV